MRGSEKITRGDSRKSARKKGDPGGTGEKATCAVGTACAEPVYFSGLSCDNWNFSTSNPCVYGGGNYNQNGNHGLFYLNYNSVSNQSGNIGSRFLF